MSINYTHHSNVGGAHDVLPSTSDIDVSSANKTILFKKYKTVGGTATDNTTSFTYTEGFPNTFSGTITGWGNVTGYFIITDNNKGIHGGIKRQHSNVGPDTEDDIGTYSGTHNV